MIYFYALLLVLAASASDKDAYEKSYPRDNTFCQIGKVRLEIMIRGDNKLTEPMERMWGEHVFMGPESHVTKLPVTERSGLYRLFPGSPSSCTKAIGTKIGKKFVLFFQKLNSPHKNQLVLQYFDLVTQRPLEVMHTPYLSDTASVGKERIVFRTHPPVRQDIQMGKVRIHEKTYLYQDHRFPIWVGLDEKGFSADPRATFESFSYKGFFKDLADFKSHSGWNEAEKSFANDDLYVAIDHATKSKCIVMLKEKTSPKGDESWICQ